MSDLLANVGSWSPVLVVMAGFMTSLHCAGMCGPLILGVARSRTQLWIYHLARLSSYTLAGAAAGAVGRDLRTLTPDWFSAGIIIFLACVLIAFGIAQLRLKSIHMRMPKFLQRAQSVAFKLRDRAPALAAGLTGALSLFLPCGHLYAFLGAATASGSALKGAVVMASFALSTWPVLFLGLRGLQAMLSAGSKLRLSGVLFILAGLLSLASFATGLQTKRVTTNSPAAEIRCH